ncbi:MAG: hypothetical protein IV100_20900 [Myxococcales bacterium]|nr:hypothetical protein [Myxococcales bacterium]
MADYQRLLSDPAAAQQVLDRELVHGGAFIPTDAPPRPLSRVNVRVVLPSGHGCEVTGTAVNVIAGGFFVHFDSGPAEVALRTAVRAATVAAPAPAPPAVEPEPAVELATEPAAEPVTESPTDDAALEVAAGSTLVEADLAAALESTESAPGTEARERLKSVFNLLDPASTVPLHRQIGALTVGERIRLARVATRPVRKVLIRDVEKQLHLVVMTNPKTSDAELEEWSAMPAVSAEALRWISNQKRLISRPIFQMNLVQNPSTPQEIALRLIAVLPISELHRIMRSTKVRETLRKAAKKRLTDTGNL